MDLASKDDKIVLIFGDVSVYLFNDFVKKYHDRFYNLGICENTLVSVGAGMSSRGFFPFIHTIAPFITERSFEQIKIDMCYNQFGGNIVSCGASFDYASDGATHHSYYDLALLRLLPNIEVIQPGSKKELDILLRSQYSNGRTTYFRLSDYPHSVNIPVEFGKGVIIKDLSASVTIMSAGPILGNVLEACKDLEINLVYFHTIKPIDRDLIQKFRNTDIIVIHDAFGLYEAICEVGGLSVSYYGLKDEYCNSYGKINDVHRCLGLDSESIKSFLRTKIKNRRFS
jgi:transketolase